VTEQLPFLEHPDLEDYKLHRRFDRIGRLVGDAQMARLLKTHVMVIGLGGVGSYAAEMVVRSGVGTVSIVDFDQVCITNFNRQLPALKGEIGKYKAETLGQRFQLINPQATIHVHKRFYNRDSSDELLASRPDYVIDAIDSITSKAHLLSRCMELGIKVVCSTGASGRLDPTRIEVGDLSRTRMDPLARMIRKILRSKYGFPSKGRFGIPAVFSAEPVIVPKSLAYEKGKGFRCLCPQGQNEFFTCDNRNVIHGTAGFVTASFGLTCTSLVVRDVIGEEIWPTGSETRG